MHVVYFNIRFCICWGPGAQKLVNLEGAGPRQSGLIIVTLDWFWDLGTFLVGSRLYPRTRPHNPSIQTDTTHASLSPQGALGRWHWEESKNWQNVARQGYKAIFGTRWKIWRHRDRELAGNPGAHPVGLVPGSKTRKSGLKIQKLLDLPGFRAEIITYD